jgi:GNAT superfamily N-acetyltransferase
MVEIREITDESELEQSVSVIRDAFSTVAQEFNLTQESAPTHPFFSTWEQLVELHKKAAFFGLYIDETQSGFVAVEKAEGGAFFFGRLAVIPQLRHHGYGTMLVRFVLDYVKKQGGSRVALGMIDGHTVLKEWYKSLGFVQTGTKKFEHLPFLVCFMEKAISAEQVE